MLINSFIIYGHLNNFPGLYHKEFRLQVGWEYILSGKGCHPLTSKYQPYSQAAHPPLPKHLPSSLHLPLFYERREK